MADGSFAHVPVEGFTAFSSELSTGGWGNVDISIYVGADGRAAKPLGDAPTLVTFKLQLAWAIEALVRAWSDGVSAAECDDRWDMLQKRLSAHLALGMHQADSEQKAAAMRLRKMLVLGNGKGQTKLKYHQEVDFGRKQVLLTAQGPGAADVVLLGLGSLMTDISNATEALALVLGHGSTIQAPNRRKRAALAACSATFGAVKQALGWMSEFGAFGADRERALALRSSLVDLALRYPAPTAESTKVAPPAAQVATG